MSHRGEDQAKRIMRLSRRFKEYYRVFYGIDISSKKSFLDIPFSVRDKMNRFSSEFISGEPIFVTRTSGSTDESFFIFRNRECFRIHLERQVKIYNSLKLTPKDRFLNLLSYSISGAARIIDGALKQLGIFTIPIGSIKNNEHLSFAIKTINELKPSVIQSYVNEVYDLFSALKKNHSIKKCILTGELLSPGFKKWIVKTGGVEVYNNYGSMEFSGFAISENQGDEYMRLYEDGLYIEVISEDGTVRETGRGKIVITDLENTCMPFIRYILGDAVEIIKKGTKKYVRILGRNGDSMLIDGEPFYKSEIINAIKECLGHPNFFALIDKEKPCLKDKVLLNIKPEDKCKIKKIKITINNKFRIGHLVSFRIYSGAIPKTATGKFRHIIDARKLD